MLDTAFSPRDDPQAMSALTDSAFRCRQDATSSRSRAVVILGGVPETVVARVELYDVVDWRPLAAELEGLCIAAGGQLDVKRFLLTPHIALRGRTPLEALDSPAAVPTLVELVRERIQAWRHARVVRRPF